MMQQGLSVNLPQARRAQPVSAEPIYVTVPLTYQTQPRRADRQGRSARRHPARAHPAGAADARRQVGLSPGRWRRHAAGVDAGDGQAEGSRRRESRHRFEAARCSPGRHIDDGFRRMVSISFGVHVVLLIAIALMPGGWGGASRRSESTPMFISLGGNARPAYRRDDDDRGPAGAAGGARCRTRSRDRRNGRRRRRPKWSCRRKRPRARSRLPGPRQRRRTTRRDASRRPAPKFVAGSALAETGGQGHGFGLTTGGGGGPGGYLDVGNFCCPEYLETMRMLITRNWQSKQQVVGTAR